MVILSDGVRLTLEDVPFEGGKRPPTDLPDFLDAPTFEEFKELSERAYLRRHLEGNGWNIQQTAKDLAMQRSNLYKKIEKYGLARGDTDAERG
jgi:transcriptional regulator of acetoin/glycerol metabolism